MFSVTTAVFEKFAGRRSPLPLSEPADVRFSKVSKRFRRSEYSMNYGLPALGDDVTLTVAVEGIRK
jgi:hypothetical protein